MNVARDHIHDASAVDRAYARCRDITRAQARNFHYGIRLSPPSQRKAIYAIYAWMRMADDLVDSSDSADVHTLLNRIREFRVRTDASIASEPACGENDHPVWLALSDTVRRYGLSPQPFHDMLDGQLSDAQQTEYETFDHLREYCRQVASTVGLICIAIWGYRDARTPQLAAARGVAFQLTNILRDFSQDFDAERVYLPREDFEHFGLTPIELRHWSAPEACMRFVQFNVARTATFYRDSAELDGLIGAEGRPTLWAMTSIYRRLLTKIEADPRRAIMGSRIRVSPIHKSVIALKATWLSRFGTASPEHMANLPT